MALKNSSRRRERRASERVDARLSMRVEGAADGGQAQLVTETQNISSSGVYCVASQYLPPLSKVQLTIVMPRVPGRGGSQELIKCEAIVVRCENTPGRRGDSHYQLACMFSALDPARRRLIEDFVTWRNLQALRAAVAPGRGKAAARRSPGAARTQAAARRPSVATRKRTATGARRTGR